MIRTHLDKFMSSIIGEIINKLIGVLSIGSSLAFVVMTYYDWSESDPCCRESPLYECPASCDPNNCQVKCDEFYRSRMPQTYDMVDIFICLVYLINYILQIFISHSRYTFFISNYSIMEMFIIIPVLIFPYDCNEVGLFFKALSRMLRIYKIEIFLKSKESSEDSNVSKQIQ